VGCVKGRGRMRLAPKVRRGTGKPFEGGREEPLFVDQELKRQAKKMMTAAQKVYGKQALANLNTRRRKRLEHLGRKGLAANEMK